jgi:hypothetical protein
MTCRMAKHHSHRAYQEGVHRLQPRRDGSLQSAYVRRQMKVTVDRSRVWFTVVLGSCAGSAPHALMKGLGCRELARFR